MMSLLRRQDAHRKIQLGGLIIKAKLDDKPTAVLFGLLLEAAEKLQDADNDKLEEQWRLKGDVALTVEKNFKK